MERLEKKVIHGKTYYYYSGWAWVNGKCRRVWQKYLGKLEDIVQAVEGGGPLPQYATIFQWGLPVALYQECLQQKIISCIDKLCPKRKQGLSMGEYIALASINRAICPTSKRSFWEWFSGTALMRYFPQASQKSLASQRFWDHMDKLDEQRCHALWEHIITGIIQDETIDLKKVSYDGTNFYTFIDTFNLDCTLAKRGNNKQGRSNLRQINYALFCSSDGHIPLHYDVYEGNRNDISQFPLMVDRFHHFLQKFLPDNGLPAITVIFDKGNNSTANFQLLDACHLHYVGSVRLDELKDLAHVSNNDSRFQASTNQQLEGTKSFRTTKTIYGKQRLLVVTYNDNFFHSQWQTLHTDITTAFDKLSAVSQTLHDRAAGLIKAGPKPTIPSLEKKCHKILKRRYLKTLIPIQITKGSKKTQGIPSLTYRIDTEELQKLSDTYLGKHILITSRHDWTNDQIMLAYRSQFLIEDVFKEMKDRNIGSWWPLFHWTDSKIQVHGLYCTLAVLIRSLLIRRIHQAGHHLSLKRIFRELGEIKEVINVYPKKRKQKKERTQAMLTQLSEMQQQLLKILNIRY